MRLIRLQPKNFGPFDNASTLDIEPGVTVLTGPNDVGKSQILRLIALMCNDDHEPAIAETDVNIDYLYGRTKDWKTDPDIGCLATFAVTDRSRIYLPAFDTSAITEVDVMFQLALHRRAVVRVRKSQGKFSTAQASVDKVPLSISLPRRSDPPIGNVIDLTTPNLAQRELLELAFSGPYEASRWSQMTDAMFGNALFAAERRLNEALAKLVPQRTNLHFRLRGEGTKGRQVALYLEDAHGAVTPAALRGSGIRKLIQLLGVLLRAPLGTGHSILLIDEPETSLHPDAQHFLRRVLESIAGSGFLQVIYATHSPSMINPLRAASIRVLERKRADGDHAVTHFVNRPIHKNLGSVRGSLGMSPADSLFLAPVIIVVEGVSELLVIPILVARAAESKVAGFTEGVELLSQTVFWDAEGDNYKRSCSFARAQQVTPILFLDGDKRAECTAETAPGGTLAGVASVVLDGDEELEDLLPRDAYFAALSSTRGMNEQLSAQDFATWEATNCPSTREQFTKRVQRWLTATTQSSHFDKVKTASVAAETATLSDVKLEPLRRLLELIRVALATPIK